MVRPLSRNHSLLPALFLAAAFAGFAGTGCNAPGPRSGDTAHLDYLSARGYDFLDIFELNAGGGPGLQAALEVTPIRVAFGHYHDCRFGMFGRAMGSWEQERSEFWIGLHTLLCWCKKPCCGNAYLFT